MKTHVWINPFARYMALLCAIVDFINPLTRAAGAKLPSIYAFNVGAEATVNLGDTVEFNWSVGEADTVTLSPGVGAVTGTSVTVTPTTTTTYVLTATNAAGSVTKSKKITVIIPPVFEALAATPASITLGGSTKLSWTAPGATYVAITADNDFDPGNVFGTSVTVKPKVTTTYTLTAVNTAGTATKGITVEVSAPVAKPAIASFLASPSSIVAGASTTLTWAVNGATSLSISPGIGAVTGTGIIVSPTANTTYTLTATNAGGSVTKTVAVTVTTPPPAPVIGSFAATPTTIARGGASMLNWSVTGATSLAISADVGASPGVVTGTSVSVSPTANTTFTLTATSSGGSVTKSVTVTVNDPWPVVHSFGSVPATIDPGKSTTLFWDVSGATAVAIDASQGASPGMVTGTSMVISPVVTTLYTLTATNATGGVTHSVAQVTVTAAPPPLVPVITSFAAAPNAISLGSSTTLNWSVTGATALAISADVGASPGVVTGTSTSVSPTANTVYTLTATNSFGSVTQTANVTVTGPSAPTIGSFGASPSFIHAGDSATLIWSVSGATSLAITADVGPSPGAVTGTSISVSPTTTTSYTLTATNAIGSTTAVAPVTIFTAGNGAVVHPRMWVTAATLPGLQARAAANDPAWIRLRNDCDAFAGMAIVAPDQTAGDNTINGGYEYLDYLLPSEELSLGYLVAKTVDPTRAARYATKERQLLLVLSDPSTHGRPTTDSGYSIRAYVPALAIGYDWIFETLSDADRAQIYTEINRWVASFDSVGFGRDYPQGNYFAGYYCAKALGALATEGENPGAAAMYGDWLNRIHYGMVQPYYSQWLSGGGAPDGWNYGPFETRNMLRPIAAVFTARGLDLIHDPKPMAYFDGHARWMTQFTWPDLKTVSDRGFVYNSDNPTATDVTWATEYNGLLHLANGSNTPIMQRYMLDLRAQQGASDEPWADFLFVDTTAPAADYRTQLSYQTTGDGQVAMRSSWATDAVWGAFQSGPFTGFPDSSEEAFDEGALTIQRGNVQFLVNTWGAMMRDTPGTSDGDPVFDDVYNDLFGDATDGVHAGRRNYNTYYAVRPGGYWGQVGATPFDGAATTLSRLEEGGGYVLMRGTKLEQQYADDHPITAWTRTIAYVRPQLFVVYDRTSLKTASADNWLAWHVAPAPTERTASEVAGTHSFDVLDTRAAFGGNLFRGRVTTVLPAGHVVTPVNVFNRGKVYRLEVRPGTPAASNTWLTVLDAAAAPTSASSAAPLSAASGNVLAGAVEGTVITGAAGQNVVVFFSKAGAAVTGTIEVLVPVASTDCLATDLQPNTGYTVTATVANGSIALQFTPGGTVMTTAQGTLALNVSAGGAVTAP